jgi:hypothetical protein
MKTRPILVALLPLLACLSQAHAKNFLVFEFNSVSGSRFGRGQTSKYSTSSLGSQTLLWIIELDRAASVGSDGYNEVAYFTGDPGSERDLWADKASKTIFYKLNGGHAPNMHHRLIYGRSNAGKGQYKFSVLYQQVDGMNDDGTHDNAVAYSITPCVQWPYKGQSIGLNGYYPLTLSLNWLRLDGGADANDRVAKQFTLLGKLLPEVTRLLNLQNVADLVDAQDWIISYYAGRGYSHSADQRDD